MPRTCIHLPVDRLIPRPIRPDEVPKEAGMTQPAVICTASISLPKCEPPQATILRRLSCLFNAMKKDNFSDAPFLYEKL